MQRHCCQTYPHLYIKAFFFQTLKISSSMNGRWEEEIVETDLEREEKLDIINFTMIFTQAHKFKLLAAHAKIPPHAEYVTFGANYSKFICFRFSSIN
jgi:hypothetical protein